VYRSGAILPLTRCQTFLSVSSIQSCIARAIPQVVDARTLCPSVRAGIHAVAGWLRGPASAHVNLRCSGRAAPSELPAVGRGMEAPRPRGGENAHENSQALGAGALAGVCKKAGPGREGKARTGPAVCGASPCAPAPL
jgi:hypothetical protein